MLHKQYYQQPFRYFKQLVQECTAYLGVYGEGSQPNSVAEAALTIKKKTKPAHPLGRLPRGAAATETLSVFEKLGCPRQFPAVTAIPEQKFDEAWLELSEFMQRKGIYLNVCSPVVSSKELYRFTLEELFHLPLNAADSPDLHYLYYYDNFHPDPFYESTEVAVKRCMTDLFRPVTLKEMDYLLCSGIQLNDHVGLSPEIYFQKITGIRDIFDHLSVESLEDRSCQVHEQSSLVQGHYRVKAVLGKEEIIFSGDWRIRLIFHSTTENWKVKSVKVEGIPF